MKNSKAGSPVTIRSTKTFLDSVLMITNQIILIYLFTNIIIYIKTNYSFIISTKFG